MTAADEASGGGGGGGTAIELFTAATIGASKLYVAGAGAAAAGTGSTSRLGAVGSELIQATGGGPGLATGNTTTVGVQAAGGAGGAGSLGNLNIQGQPGMRAVIYSTTHGCGGAGGSSAFGVGGHNLAQKHWPTLVRTMAVVVVVVIPPPTLIGLAAQARMVCST